MDGISWTGLKRKKHHQRDGVGFQAQEGEKCGEAPQKKGNGWKGGPGEERGKEERKKKKKTKTKNGGESSRNFRQIVWFYHGDPGKCWFGAGCPFQTVPAKVKGVLSKKKHRMGRKVSTGSTIIRIATMCGLHLHR